MNKAKLSLFGCIVSAVALLIAIVMAILRGFAGPSLTLFFSSIAIFCANIAVHFSEKKKTQNAHK